MKRFAHMILLAAVISILVTAVREAEGQLGFRFPRLRRKPGRSLKTNYARKRIVSAERRMEQQNDVMLERKEELEWKEIYR
ncbi:hypothetical protein ACROYT_G009331 [Oculina patagonica]